MEDLLINIIRTSWENRRRSRERKKMLIVPFFSIGWIQFHIF